jgi:cytochrome c553
MKIKDSAKLLLIAAATISLAGCERPGASIEAEGAALAQEKGCIACHGLNGKGTGPTFPDIQGQWPSYVRHQLVKYRDGDRVNAIMNGQAAALTDHDIDILTRYYTSQ